MLWLCNSLMIIFAFPFVERKLETKHFVVYPHTFNSSVLEQKNVGYYELLLGVPISHD